jgi:hypothetical protein
MSKSRGNIINIFSEDKALRKQIMSIETDSTPLEEPKNSDTCKIFGLYKLLANAEQIAQMKIKYANANRDFGYGHAKQELFELIFDNRKYMGVEDIRIFNDVETKNLLFIGTGLHRSNNIGIVIGEYDIDSFCLKGHEIVPDFSNSTCEKNWVFVDYNNSTHIIYNWHPLQICKIKNDTAVLSLIKTRKMPNIFTRIRGSTCGFKYSRAVDDTEIWFVTHMVSYEEPRHYYHVIVVFESNMNLLRYSAPFKFEGEPIEYCLSIVVEDEQVIMNYSTWDRTTRIGVYDKKYIDSIVKYN